MKVKELIEKLSSFDPEAVVVIVDADTGWPLNVNRVEAGVGDWSALVVIGGDYQDRAQV